MKLMIFIVKMVFNVFFANEILANLIINKLLKNKHEVLKFK